MQGGKLSPDWNGATTQGVGSVLESDWLQAGSRMERQAEPWKAGFSERQGANAPGFFLPETALQSKINCEL